MKNWIHIPVVLISLLALALAGSGCGSACEELANKICNCQPTRSKVDRCKITVDSATRNLDLSDEEEDRCQSILDSGLCSCDALNGGDFASCGLAAEPSTDVTD